MPSTTPDRSDRPDPSDRSYSSPGRVVIEEATGVDDELADAFSRLVPQLSSSPVPGKEELAAIARSDTATLLVARDGHRAIIGSLTLVLFRVPTGVRAWIEDVVVDEKARSSGVGESLVRAALSRATAAGARSVDLTSRPSREPANRLYRRLGFAVRETNVYRWSGDSTPPPPPVIDT